MSGDKAQARHIIDHMNELSSRLSEFRGREVKCRINFERAKVELAAATSHKTIELSHLPHLAGAIDPKTGKSNADFSKFLLDEEMRNDDEFRIQIVQFYEAQESYYEAQNDMLDVAEQLSVAKSQARLVAAILTLEAAEDSDLAETLGGTD